MWMKMLLGALLVGITIVSQPAAAAPWDSRPRLQERDQRMAPRKGPGQREMQRERRMGSGQREMQREQRMAPERDQSSQGKLTEEERRELRRDVDRANREIYRRRFER